MRYVEIHRSGDGNTLDPTRYLEAIAGLTPELPTVGVHFGRWLSSSEVDTGVA
jgi:hypothetical protein